MDELTFVLKQMDQRMTRMEDKIDTLLKFKWQIVGMACAVGTISGTIATILLK